MKLNNISEDALVEHMDDIDLEDFEMIDSGCIVFTKPTELFNTKKYFESKSIDVKDLSSKVITSNRKKRKDD